MRRGRSARLAWPGGLVTLAALEPGGSRALQSRGRSVEGGQEAPLEGGRARELVQAGPEDALREGGPNEGGRLRDRHVVGDPPDDVNREGRVAGGAPDDLDVVPDVP